MELHKILPLDLEKISLDLSYRDFFKKSLDFTLKYYNEDYFRILRTNFSEITSDSFFTEYCWCVYTSGFNAKVVSKFFKEIVEVYKPLLPIFSGLPNASINTIDIAINAMVICKNKRKIKAIIDTAFLCGKEIEKSDWNSFKEANLNSPEKLQKLPYIGPITCYHLARNIGLLNYVKPDLHLERAAAYWGFSSPLDLCSSIKKEFGLPLGMIDLCLWYALSTFGSK